VAAQAKLEELEPTGGKKLLPAQLIEAPGSSEAWYDGWLDGEMARVQAHSLSNDDLSLLSTVAGQQGDLLGELIVSRAEPFGPEEVEDGVQ